MDALKLALIAAVAAGGPAWSAPKADPLAARAATATIVRDQWRPYPRAKRRRVETNFLTSLGWLSETEGEAALWKDLRQRLWIGEARLRAQFASRRGCAS